MLTWPKRKPLTYECAHGETFTVAADAAWCRCDQVR